ncbi:unnamed protein product [Moneuplotes crassus]|uniref:Uncharacterized protein n=1 Tax=Euplotes crassus TaxID=5936 RepID=A0AAD1U3X6_EUPCR|nr:unnamed protein product [Moneuplotes crassus]
MIKIYVPFSYQPNEDDRKAAIQNLGVPKFLVNKWLNVKNTRSHFRQSHCQIDNKDDVSIYSGSSFSIVSPIKMSKKSFISNKINNKASTSMRKSEVCVDFSSKIGQEPCGNVPKVKSKFSQSGIKNTSEFPKDLLSPNDEKEIKLGDESQKSEKKHVNPYPKCLESSISNPIFELHKSDDDSSVSGHDSKEDCELEHKEEKHTEKPQINILKDESEAVLNNKKVSVLPTSQGIQPLSIRKDNRHCKKAVSTIIEFSRIVPKKKGIQQNSRNCTMDQLFITNKKRDLLSDERIYQIPNFFLPSSPALRNINSNSLKKDRNRAPIHLKNSHVKGAIFRRNRSRNDQDSQNKPQNNNLNKFQNTFNTLDLKNYITKQKDLLNTNKNTCRDRCIQKVNFLICDIEQFQLCAGCHSIQ